MMVITSSSVSSTLDVTLEGRMDDSRPSTLKSKTAYTESSGSDSSEPIIHRSAYLLAKEKDSFFSKYRFSFPQRRYDMKGRRKHKFFGMQTHDSMDDDYDYRLKKQDKSAGIKGGIAALVKACVGGGIVSLHESYKECGMWSSLMVNIVLGIIISYCMYEMARVSHKLFARTNLCILAYPDMIEAVCEFSDWTWLQRLSRTLRQACFIFGRIIAFFQIYGTVTLMRMEPGVYRVIGQVDHFNLSMDCTRLYFAAIVVPCAAMAVLVPMKNLAPFSIILNFFIVILCLSTIHYSVSTTKTISNPLDLPVYKSLEGLCEVVGNILFAMDGVGISLAVENNIKNPKDFPLVVVGGMPIVMALGMIIGAFGYWGWGEQCATPITLNFPWAAFAVPMKMFTAMVMYVTFGISFWVPSNIVWCYVARYHDFDTQYIDKKIWRFVLVMMTIMIAAMIPNICKFLAILGCFCHSLTGFVFPTAFALILDWEKPGLGKYYWRIWKATFFITLGLVIFIVGTSVNAAFMIYEFLILDKDDDH